MIIAKGDLPVRFTAIRLTMLLACACGMLSGCAIYDPQRVWRVGFDYNTERQLSAQWSIQDHLPPKHVAVRLMKWGYNVGPSARRPAYMIPVGSQVEPQVAPPTGVLPGKPDDQLEQAFPPAWPPHEILLPPEPTGLPRRPLAEPYGPTARPVTQPTATPAAWIFGSP